MHWRARQLGARLRSTKDDSSWLALRTVQGGCSRIVYGLSSQSLHGAICSYGRWTALLTRCMGTSGPKAMIEAKLQLLGLQAMPGCTTSLGRPASVHSRLCSRASPWPYLLTSERLLLCLVP